MTDLTPHEQGAATAYERRFWGKVATGTPDECWEWMASRSPRGYGQIMSEDGSRNLRAHRVAYRLSLGPIPQGLLVCHRCDNPPCCNPAHLFLGTSTDNNRDCARKGRTNHPSQRGQENGKSRLTVENVKTIRGEYATGATTQHALAARFGVAETTVGDIIRGRTWTHV